MIQAVVFDLDNTLYDYDSCNAIAEKKLFETIESDFDIPADEAADMLRKAKKSVKSRLGEEVAAAHNRLLYMQNICEQVGRNPLKYAMGFYDTYWDTMLDQMTCFEYVKPLLAELRVKGIRIGILTDLTAHIQYRKLKRLGLVDSIDCLVTSEEAGAEKPAEEMFRLILDKLGVEPDKALMIGDSERKDIVGARKLGMKTLLIGECIDVAETTRSLLG